MRVYLHFPFCLEKCPYCDFHSLVAPDRVREEYLEALLAEVESALGGGAAHGRAIESVYCGGGTPSLYTPRELGRVLVRLGEVGKIPPEAEVTVEINPATWSERQLEEAVSEGFNRFSIGVQSFDAAVLSSLGRRHGAPQARRLVGYASHVEGASLGVDLIFGVPGQSLVTWVETLEETLEYRPDHVSAYALTVGPSTPLAKSLERGEAVLPEEDLVAEMYDAACRCLGEAGYHHYEISNFALPGSECEHNLACWRREDYLGLGVSAHSFHRPASRTRNLKDLREYMRRARSGRPVTAEVEGLRPEEVREEEVMLSLRTDCGLQEDALQACGVGGGEARAAWDSLVAEGLAWRGGGRCGLTERGMFVSNHIIAGLFEG